MTKPASPRPGLRRRRSDPILLLRPQVVDSAWEAGSVLILVLFACLGVAVCIQALSTMVLCAQRAAVDESSGRARMDERDQALAVLSRKALTSWEAAPWAVVLTEPNAVEGRIAKLPEGSDWVMEATARHASAVSRLLTSAWLERGRDGIDLPLAALVGGELAVSSERGFPWLEVDRPGTSDDVGSENGSGAVGYLRILPPNVFLGEGCSLAKLDDPWRLDSGWTALDAVEDLRNSGPGDKETDIDGVAPVAPGNGVVVISGRRGQTLALPSDCGGLASESPCLVLVTGGANLDTRGRGDIYGVMVVDGGDLLLEGTTVHGAVFATGTVDLGSTGVVLFSRSILRWATDRSLVRVRLVAGTRKEGME